MTVADAMDLLLRGDVVTVTMVRWLSDEFAWRSDIVAATWHDMLGGRSSERHSCQCEEMLWQSWLRCDNHGCAADDAGDRR